MPATGPRDLRPGRTETTTARMHLRRIDRNKVAGLGTHINVGADGHTTNPPTVEPEVPVRGNAARTEPSLADVGCFALLGGFIIPERIPLRRVPAGVFLRLSS